MPFGSRQRVPETPVCQRYSLLGYARLHLHLSSRNTRWSHCPANVIQHPDPGRINTRINFRGYHVVHQYLPGDREMDYRLRFHHRLIVHLRAFPSGNRLEHSPTRMGHPCFPRRFHGCYYERTRGRGHAPQSIPPLRGHPKPSVEYTRR